MLLLAAGHCSFAGSGQRSLCHMSADKKTSQQSSSVLIYSAASHMHCTSHAYDTSWQQLAQCHPLLTAMHATAPCVSHPHPRLNRCQTSSNAEYAGDILTILLPRLFISCSVCAAQHQAAARQQGRKAVPDPHHGPTQHRGVQPQVQHTIQGGHCCSEQVGVLGGSCIVSTRAGVHSRASVC